MDEIKIKPAYYAIIPATVRYADIPANAKLLYGEITALSSKEGFCWASNPYFAELYGVDALTISRWVTHLVKSNFIRIEVDKGAGNYRKIWLIEYPPIDKIVNSYPQKNQDPYPQKNQYSNTSVNTKNNNLGDFENFWLQYPNKAGKKKAQIKWNNLPKKTKDLILADLPKRLKTEQWLKDGGKFVPHATTYLNGERWNDPIVITPAPEKSVTGENWTQQRLQKEALEQRADPNSPAVKKFRDMKEKFKIGEIKK